MSIQNNEWKNFFVSEISLLYRRGVILFKSIQRSGRAKVTADGGIFKGNSVEVAAKGRLRRGAGCLAPRRAHGLIPLRLSLLVLR